MSSVKKPATPSGRLPPKSVRSLSKITPSTRGKENEQDKSIFTTPKVKIAKRGSLRTPLSVDRRHGAAPSTPVGGTPVRRSRGSAGDPLASLLADQAVTVKVGVRVRPMTDRERSDPEVSRIVSGDGSCVLLDTELHPSQAFYYDHVFWSIDPADQLFHNQKQVYESVAAPLLKSAFEGYNVCLLAYGQTGSGKTYSMMGRLGAEDAGTEEPCELAGVIPRFCVDLFKQTASAEYQTTVQVSYYEIYQERIRDLLAASDDKRSGLRVREHPSLGPHVVGLTAVAVDGWPLMRSLMDQGNRLRATASTGMNNKSSRSHSVLTLTVTQTQTETVDGEQLESQQTAQVNLVDLAGSERVAQAHTTGVRLREGVVINKSLLTLGKVIMALVDGGRAHIPYRESALTWLLKESLGGNSRTAMLATISPCSSHAEETLSTLRYACKTNQIVNSVHVNEDPRARIIRELRAELERLRQEQSTPVAPAAGEPADQQSPSTGTDSPNAIRHRLAITQLKRKLQQKELMLRSQHNELEEAKRRLAEGGGAARPAAAARPSAGVPFVGHVSQPSLVNLLPDPALTETVAYPLAEGDTTLGAAETAAVRLHGLLIDKLHCSVTRSGTRVTLHPSAGCVCTVNGSEVTAPTALQHGDRLVLAGEVFLRLHLPAHPLLGLRDFADAKAELDRKNEEKAAQEQERLRQRVKQELLQELEQEQADAELEKRAQQIQLEKQIDTLKEQLEQLKEQERRPPVRSTDSPADSSSLNVSLYHSDLLEQIEGVFGDSSGRGSSGRSAAPSAAHPPVSAPDAARLSQLVTEGNALLRRLNKKVTLSSDLELSGGTLRPVAMVTDGEHGVCTSWNLETLEDKVASLRQLWEERDSSSTSLCDVSVVLDSRSGWRQQHDLRRSGRLADDDGQPEEAALSVAEFCSPLVHECADWRSAGARPVLLGIQALQTALGAVEGVWRQPALLRAQDSFTEALVGLLSRWFRLSSAFAVWRRGRLSSEEDVEASISQLDDVMDRLQNGIGFIYQGVGGRVSSLAEEHLSGCRRLTVRLCRLIGTAAEELTEPETMTEGLSSDTLTELTAGAVMALDHAMLQLIRSCEDAEVLITGLVDDSVAPESADSGGLYSAAHELVACLRSWLQRGRTVQTAASSSGDSSGSSDSDPSLKYRLASVQQACGWVTALSSAVRLIVLAVDRHHRGARLDRATLCDAVRKLLHSCRRLTPGRSELAAAAGAVLRHLDAADDSASTVLSGASDGGASRAARTPDTTMFGSLLDSPAGECLSPLPADQMAARLRQAVRQLERSPSKSSLRTPDSPVKGRVQFSRPARADRS
ncbi:kinesin-like protein KIF14 [Amphibalanus amphitrite]|uniref:kinesin-like protein KIF14 n=1 Tax=Amphibalanus amphitrite TaxID=1232801 RepID=UPI001C8FF998|nr:kinesin-like protein KIF14 [Amphibalanus amphitrite]